MKNIKNSHTENSIKISGTYPKYNLTRMTPGAFIIIVIKSSGMLLE